MLLDCGHEDDWSPGFGCTGPQGHKCTACAHNTELQALLSDSKGFAYLDADEDTLTDFAGLKLARVCGRMRKGSRVWSFRAVDIHGQVWSCLHWPYAGTYVRMRKVV